MSEKTALITGITGQDGSYLAELLLAKEYNVHGIIRRASNLNTSRIEHLLCHERLTLHYGDLSDSSSLYRIILQVQPHEIYNLGALSHVRVSFELSEYTADVDGLGALRLLNCIRACGMERRVRFYQASTSELFGNTKVSPQNELTPFCPRSPYGIAKQFAYYSVINYREAYAMYAVNGILFNHESPRRGTAFVSRKITRAVVRIKRECKECLHIGNLNAMRDWGHARDYVCCMWKMLQQDEPEDFVVATGESHSVREFIELAFQCVEIPIVWRNAQGGLEEIGVHGLNPDRVLVRVDAQYFRPTEVDALIGDASKARRILGWEAQVRFQELVMEMVVCDMEELKKTGQ